MCNFKYFHFKYYNLFKGEDMKTRKTSLIHILISFCVLSLLIGFQMIQSISDNNIQITANNEDLTLAIKADSPIYIDGNYWLEQNATAGDGSAANPYIIENYIINASGLGVHGIHIQNTNKSFILQNCTVTNIDALFHGIFL